MSIREHVSLVVGKLGQAPLYVAELLCDKATANTPVCVHQ